MLIGGANIQFSKSDKTQSSYREVAIVNETSWIWTSLGDGFDILLAGNNSNYRIWFSHFVQLSIITLWFSGMFIQGARFSNYSLWLTDPGHGHARTL